MTPPQYDFDPELAGFVPMLPVVMDHFADPAAIAAARLGPGLVPSSQPRDDVLMEDISVPGADGEPDVGVRVYVPVAPSDSSRPGVLFIHGGGFMMGSVDQTDAACQALSAALGAAVVSVEYRLAPEHPYPAALNDCYSALTWLAQGEGLDVDLNRIAVVGGSAGAGLAAAVTLLARDRGGPALCFQVLLIPELDDRLNTPSMQRFTDTPLWNLPNAEWSWRHYLGDLHGQPDVPAYAAPARCDDLSGLPPAYISTMEFDPLRDEGLLYALRLLQAGVQVEVHSFPGTFHGSALFADAAVSKREGTEMLESLRRAFRVPAGVEPG